VVGRGEVGFAEGLGISADRGPLSWHRYSENPWRHPQWLNAHV